MMMRWVFLRVFLFVFWISSTVVGAGGGGGYHLPPVTHLGKDISFTYAGNHKLSVYIPKSHFAPKHMVISSSSSSSSQKFPVVIFNYDELVDKLGEPLAIQSGYDINAFVSYFARHGYATIVPLQRFTNVYSVKAALKYIDTDSRLDRKQIHLFGHSSGAFISLLAAKDFPYIKSMFLVAPYASEDTGYYSVPQVRRDVRYISHIPIVLISSDLMSRNHFRSFSAIKEALKPHVSALYIKNYPFELKYFWSPDNPYMEDFWHLVNNDMSGFYLQPPAGARYKSPAPLKKVAPSPVMPKIVPKAKIKRKGSLKS